MAQNNKIKLTFTLDPDTKEGNYKFTPAFDSGNFTKHFANLLSGFAQSTLSLCSFISTLRPVTKEERDAHIYVFKTDDKEDAEHRLYALRKNLYDALGHMFETTLATCFPDIQYIEDCKKYQQEFAFDESKSNEDNLFDVEMITQTVREHWDELFKEGSTDVSVQKE